MLYPKKVWSIPSREKTHIYVKNQCHQYSLTCISHLMVIPDKCTFMGMSRTLWRVTTRDILINFTQTKGPFGPDRSPEPWDLNVIWNFWTFVFAMNLLTFCRHKVTIQNYGNATRHRCFWEKVLKHIPTKRPSEKVTKWPCPFEFKGIEVNCFCISLSIIAIEKCFSSAFPIRRD